ncbi:hypothetical protein CDD83_6500 [Cordyceps sp. RAO-2017]|nr:hypothetical protein CDD83_6500 [Cordyceps sp. RAO-2017]
MLIELVGATKAAWSKMEELHNDRFEHPRNQQAYRDKARNLKVDMLARDLCLPPYFDLVVLGPKEVNKVKGLGKNPKRREHEVDEQTGTPYNTELLL